jgi:wobble nucleotide-excising tRNase
MLKRFQLLENVGQFHSTSSPAASPLLRYVLIYAENGRGKTTLSAVFHSLASGDALKISERRRLGSQNNPHVVLTHDANPPPFVFQNGAWNRTLPDLAIFDDLFVNENVYSGLSVDPDHRQNLHFLVIGANGVALNRQLQDCVGRIEAHIIQLRNRQNAIPISELGNYPVDIFCGLPVEPDVEVRIQEIERSLSAAIEQDKIQTTAPFSAVGFPDFNVEAIEQTLGQTLDTLNTTVASQVQEHFQSLGPRGENWVQEGMNRIPHTDGGDVCPFCVQDLGSSHIIEQYRAYFGREYAALKVAISSALDQLREEHSRELPLRLERTLGSVAQLRAFWTRFTEVPDVSFDSETFIRDWQMSRDGLVRLLEAKSASPLEPLFFTVELSKAIADFRAERAELRAVSDALSGCNGRVTALKARAAAANPSRLQQELSWLRACQRRHSPELAVLCNQYLEEREAKAATEQLRDETRQQIEQHRAIAFPTYQAGINRYLERFGVAFRLDRVAPADTRGGATCNYDFVINNVSIPITADTGQNGQPCFRNTLSSGDRNALALAFFFAALDVEPNLAQKIVVLDDPLSSLDENRAFATVQEVRSLGGRVAQLVLLSHDKAFLGRVWEGVRRDDTICRPLKIQRAGQSSVIEDWDVGTDSITEHDRNHLLLREYLRNGPGASSRPIAVAIRPLLEGFARVAFPEHCTSRPRAFSQFMAICHQRLGTPNEILNAQDYHELNELVEYGNLFHHETNAAWETAPVNDAELHGYVTRTLDFAAR